MIYSARSLVLLSMLAYLLNVVQQVELQNQTHTRDGAAFNMALEDVRPGMKGYGRLLAWDGQAKCYRLEVLHVVRNVSPGCDLVLCRLPRQELNKADLDILGGSPVYVGVQMLGTVACIARGGDQTVVGVSPSLQIPMDSDAVAAADLAQSTHGDLKRPLRVGSHAYRAVSLTAKGPLTGRDDGVLRLALLPRVQPAGWSRQAGLAMYRRRSNGGL